MMATTSRHGPAATTTATSTSLKLILPRQTQTAPAAAHSVPLPSSLSTSSPAASPSSDAVHLVSLIAKQLVATPEDLSLSMDLLFKAYCVTTTATATTPHPVAQTPSSTPENTAPLPMPPMDDAATGSGSGSGSGADDSGAASDADTEPFAAKQRERKETTRRSKPRKPKSDPSLAALFFDLREDTLDVPEHYAAAVDIADMPICSHCAHSFPPKLCKLSDCGIHLDLESASPSLKWDGLVESPSWEDALDRAEALTADLQLLNANRQWQVKRSTKANKKPKETPKKRYNVNMLRREAARKARVIDHISARKENSPHHNARLSWEYGDYARQQEYYGAYAVAQRKQTFIEREQARVSERAETRIRTRPRHVHNPDGWHVHPHARDPALGINHAVVQGQNPLGVEEQLMQLLVQLQHRDITPEDYEALLRLDELVARRTVSRNTLDSFPTRVLTENIIDGLCTVCLMPFDEGQTLRTLPCGHEFHVTCIDAWLGNSSMNCPVDNLPVHPRE